MDVSRLPQLNASLNAASALLLVFGWVFIRLRNVVMHRICMGSAFMASVVFLVGYLTHHFLAGIVYYRGAHRGLYIAILGTHTALAILVPFLAVRTLYLALNERFDEHRVIARLTLPIWLYVSVTGVVVYEMLYRL